MKNDRDVKGTDVKGTDETPLDDRALESISGGGKHSRPGPAPAGPVPAQIPRHGSLGGYWR